MLTATPVFGKASIWHIAPDSWDISVCVAEREYRAYLWDKLRSLSLPDAPGKVSTKAQLARR